MQTFNENNPLGGLGRPRPGIRAAGYLPLGAGLILPIFAQGQSFHSSFNLTGSGQSIAFALTGAVLALIGVVVVSIINRRSLPGKRASHGLGLRSKRYRPAPPVGHRQGETHPLTVGPPVDAAWLADLEQAVAAGIGNFYFTADVLADQLAMSRSALFRHVKQATGLTPKAYINQVRFNRALRLLETRSCQSVKAAAYAVGLRDVKYFSRQFFARYGQHPSSFLT